MTARVPLNRFPTRPSLTAALFLLTAFPLLFVLYRSVARPDGFTFEFYREVFSTRATLRAGLNTLFLSSVTVVFAASLAIPAAWLVARTDLPGYRRFRSLLLLPYMIPPYLGAIAWINLCNPTVGWLNRFASAPIFNIYSLAGMIWVLGLFFYTFIYLNCVSAMENTDPSYEEAARVSGASPLRVLTTITLPLIRPAVLSGAFLVFAATAASFGVPALIDTQGRTPVLTTRIYAYVRSGSTDGYFLAAALSALLLIVAIGTSWIADVFSHSRRITSLAGKSARISRVRLGAWRWPAFGFISLLFGAACVLPVSAIVLTSFMKVAGNFDPSNFTLAKYNYVLLDYSKTIPAFVNSILLATGVATLAIVAGLALAYLKGHPRRRSGWVLDLCVNLPYATPGTILALGMILVWTRPVQLVDTLWILLLAYFAKYLSFSVKALTTNVQQVDVTLEEASRISGAGFWTTFRRIWFPLLRPGILASWFLVFMPAFSELTMSVLLVGPETETIGTVLFYLQEYADPPSASVLAVLILVFIVTAYGLALKIAPNEIGGTAS